MTVDGRVVALGTQATIISGTARSCGLGAIPLSTATPTGAALPYTVLYDLGQTLSGAPFGDPASEAAVLVQVTSYASTADIALATADKVRRAFLQRNAADTDWAFPITLTGYKVIGRESDREDGLGLSGSNYSYVQRFKLHVSTSS